MHIFDTVIATLQGHFGPAAARWRTAVDVPLVRTISTDFATLDAALGGGIACSQATVLLGSPTTRTTTVALRTLATAQGTGGTAAYLDTAAHFDLLYAADCGLSLDQLLLVRRHTSAETLEILDAPPQPPHIPEGSALLQSVLRRLPRLLAASPTALLLLHRLPTGRCLPRPWPPSAWPRWRRSVSPSSVCVGPRPAGRSPAACRA